VIGRRSSFVRRIGVARAVAGATVRAVSLRPSLVALVLASLAALLIGAAPAAARTETATLGNVTATFSYTSDGRGKWKDLRIQVSRDGRLVVDAPPQGEQCQEPYCAPGGLTLDPSLRVVDVDGDAEPEVVVDLYTGGAHCCVVAEVLRWTGAGGYRIVTRDFADFGYTLDPPPAPGQPATFVSGDARFAYAFASFADSAFPARLLTYGAAGWRDVTTAHAETLIADAARWMKAYNKRRGGRRALGLLAAWVADQYRLGRRHQADTFLNAELRAHRLRSMTPWPGGKKYISVLKRRLKAWGYAG
jgi:hypothetical protein